MGKQVTKEGGITQEVLEIVQQQQDLFVAQIFYQLILGWFPAGEGEGQGIDKGRGEAGGLYRLQIDEEHATGEGIQGLVSRLNRQPRFAHAAGTDDGQQAADRIGQSAGHAGQFGFPADNGGCLGRERMLDHRAPYYNHRVRGLTRCSVSGSDCFYLALARSNCLLQEPRSSSVIPGR